MPGASASQDEWHAVYDVRSVRTASDSKPERFKMTGHKAYAIHENLKYIPTDVKLRHLKAALMYDPAADGPEVSLIRAFRAFPEGSYSRDYWRFVRASS